LPVVPHEQKWGIYRLDIDSHKVELLFTSATEISYMRLNTAGDQFVFSQTVGGDAHDQEEIFTLTSDGRRLRRLTDNGYWDLYPTWSPDGARIAFLSQRNGNLGIFVMNADGSHPTKVFDSSSDEADIDWVDNLVAFTKESRIWIMRPDGSDSRPVSDPPRAGEWGAAILPFGDYDPRISPDGSKVAFERLLGDESPHGNYDLFAIDLRTSEETRLTHTRFAQGLASWSHSGQQLAYIVASIDQVGQYDLYIMNTDGTGSRNITPSYFPPQFLCHWAVFSRDDTAVFFIGEWWPEE
jgi:Tol biopolymer transport system component